MPNGKRYAILLLAFACAPLGVAIGESVFFMLVGGTSSTPLGVAGYFLGWFGNILAIPAFAVAQEMRIVRWWTCVVSGALIGLAVSAFAGMFSLALAAYSALGAASGLIFWLVWRLAPADADASGRS